MDIMTAYYNRVLEERTKVFIYYNLRSKCFSMKAEEGPHKGRVVAHVISLYLEDCQFIVSQAGRKRVIDEQRKNVHAGVLGYYDPDTVPPEMTSGRDKVTYNPYLYESFIVAENKLPVRHADKVFFYGSDVYIVNEEETSQ